MRGWTRWILLLSGLVLPVLLAALAQAVREEQGALSVLLVVCALSVTVQATSVLRQRKSRSSWSASPSQR